MLWGEQLFSTRVRLIFQSLSFPHPSYSKTFNFHTHLFPEPWFSTINISRNLFSHSSYYPKPQLYTSPNFSRRLISLNITSPHSLSEIFWHSTLIIHWVNSRTFSPPTPHLLFMWQFVLYSGLLSEECHRIKTPGELMHVTPMQPL